LDQNSNENIFRIFALKNYFLLPGGFLEAFWASWKLFGLPGDLISNIINYLINSYRNPK
jgi:hypothetical protein